jgi:HD-like signal output (HDOD) protein
MLRGLRGEWEMTFAGGGEEAVAMLRSQPFDVLITDMRMPGVDGVELLKTARDEHPNVVRIVLSGHTEVAAAIRSAPLAHRFLSKPCDPITLLDTVTKACDLEDRLSSEHLRKVLGSVEMLPSAPKSTIALNELLATEDATIESVAEIIANDAAMSAKLLQLVNSAFFGLARPVTTVRDSVSYLGINVVRNLTAALGALSVFEDDNLDPAFVDAHHTHSHQVASVASELVPPAAAPEAFGFALLHDIGTLVIARCMPNESATIEAAVANGEGRSASELAVIGATHAELGGYLLALWGLPYVIVEAVARHHEQPLPEAERAVHATFLAEALVHEAEGNTAAWCEDGPPIDDDYVRSLGLGAAVAHARANLRSTGEVS